MPHKTKVTELRVVLEQALAYLTENKPGAFLEQMAALSEWLNVSSYKGHAEELQAEIKNLKLNPLLPSLTTTQQALFFEALHNAWQDEGLARVRDFVFVENRETPGQANVCQILRLQEAPFWVLIPVNQDGVKQKDISIQGQDDIEELLSQITLNKQQIKNGKPLDLQYAKRLKRALKRANIENLDQSSLSSKADLNKDVRHRIKLGMKAFQLLYFPQQQDHKEENDQLDIPIFFFDKPAEIQPHYPPNTYLVLRPRKGQKGRVWFFDEKGKKHAISSNVMHSLLNDHPLLSKELQTLFDTRNLLLMWDFFEDKNRLVGRKAQEEFDENIRLFLQKHYFRRLDEKAALAIRRYKTRSKKVLGLFENTVAALAAISYGGISVIATMVGLFVTAGIVWTNPWLAILGIFLIAGAVILPIPTTWTTWKLFSSFLPKFFSNIGAEYREINSPKKKAMFWGLSLFAIATGIATAALTYTATIALPVMFGLSAISFIFPPIGVALAAAVAIAQTVTFIRNFCDILRKENSWKTFKKPFIEVSRNLRESKASRGRQIATWTLVGALCLLTGLGLVMSCFTSTRSVGKFFIDQFMLTPDRAIWLGVAISAVSSFLSRIYFTLSSAFTVSEQTSKRLCAVNPRRFFGKDYAQYKIDVVNKTVDPVEAIKLLKPESYSPKDKVIILTPDPDAKLDDGKRIAYFVLNQKIVSTKQGIFSLPIELSEAEKRLTTPDSGAEGSSRRPVLLSEHETKAILSKPKNAEATPSTGKRNNDPVDHRYWLVKKTLALACDEMLAQENGLPPFSARKVTAVVIDSASAGAFYLWSACDLSKKTDFSHDINLGLGGHDPFATAFIGASALTTSFTRSFAIGMKYAGQPDAEETPRQKAVTQRTNKTLAFHREKNPHCLFTQPAKQKVALAKPSVGDYNGYDAERYMALPRKQA